MSILTTYTFPIALGAHDGFTSRSDSVYPPTGAITANSTSSSPFLSRSFSGANHEVSVLHYRWDTSDVHDLAPIQSVALLLNISSRTDNNGRSLQVEWHDFDTLGTEDWTLDSTADANEGILLSSFTVGQINTIPLNKNLHRINRSGFTGVRLHVSGGEPAGFNLLTLNTFENLTLRFKPMLQISVILPAVDIPPALTGRGAA